MWNEIISKQFNQNRKFKFAFRTITPECLTAGDGQDEKHEANGGLKLVYRQSIWPDSRVIVVITNTKHQEVPCKWRIKKGTNNVT